MALRKFKATVGRFRRREDGLAFIEFALVAPIMVTMYFAVSEISLAVGHSRKTALISRTVADLTTQVATVSTTYLTSIFTAAEKILAPYPSTDVSIRITSVRIDKAGKVWVDWSEVKNLSASVPYPVLGRCTDGSSLVPTGLKNKSTTLVIGQTKLKHKPVVGMVVKEVMMEDSIPMIPRLSDAVLRQNVPTTLCSGET